MDHLNLNGQYQYNILTGSDNIVTSTVTKYL